MCDECSYILPISAVAPFFQINIAGEYRVITDNTEGQSYDNEIQAVINVVFVFMLTNDILQQFLLERQTEKLA